MQRRAIRILLVDDETKLRESVAEGLRLEDWEVVTAATGADALARLRGGEFDLILLDWMLPDADGMEVLRRVRALRPKLPVLMITARIGHADQITAFQTGATDYLTKPFAFDDLIARSRALMGPALSAFVRTQS
jgi:two-component system OmpR family response regulator